MLKLPKKGIIIKDSLKLYGKDDIKEILEYYFVFDGFKFSGIYTNIFEAIKCLILRDYDKILKNYEFSKFDVNTKSLLKKLAINDRKKFNFSKIIPRKISNEIIYYLIKKDIIMIEKSREPKLQKFKYQKLKKELRHYQIQDKIHFKDNFTRFWFRFCEPNLELLKQNKFDLVLENIKNEFEMYCSLPFELISMELLSHHLNIDKSQIASYWDKDKEIDIFIDYDGFTIVGEVKYKDRKICKNILNLLKTKCDRLGISPNLIALFSKSGFSNELLKSKDDKILLFELKHFKELL